MPSADPLAEEIVRLYGLPPDEFVAARNDTAKAWRRDKRKDDAARIAALRKPSVIESAVNRTARRDPETTTAWAAATRAADTAQSATIGGADAAGLRAAVKALRTATEAMVDATVTTIGDPTKRDDVAALLRSVPVGAVDQVVTGVLGSAERLDDDLFAGAPTPPPRPARPPRERPAAKTVKTAKAAKATTAAGHAKVSAVAPAPPEPPTPPPPSRRERTLVAAVERDRAALADAVVARDRARAEVDAARRRLEGAERDHRAAETALADAERALRAERGTEAG